MKKVDKSSSAGTTSEQRTEADNMHVCQPIVKPNVVRSCFNDGVFKTDKIEQQLFLTFSPFNAHSWIYELVSVSLPYVKGLKRNKNRKIFAMKLVDIMLKDEKFETKIINGFINSKIFMEL